MPARQKKASAPVVPPVALAPICLDVKGAARYLSTTPWQVRTLIWSGELRPLKLGRKQVLRVEDLKAFVDRRAGRVA